jgi:uncharacterized protein YceH (UPF0502 family)
MKIKLNPLELRVISVLIEKEITTPDQYPLSLNALINACNQKSNREPVMDLTETVVQETVDHLIKKHLLRSHSGFGSRVSKYQHRFCNLEFGELKLDPQELAVLCELMLRGPQTPGELRSRAERMAKFTDVEQVERSLHRLADRDDPLVARLPVQPGKRESRFAHLLGDETFPVEEYVALPSSSQPSAYSLDRLQVLEQRVGELEAQVIELKQLIDLMIQAGK